MTQVAVIQKLEVNYTTYITKLLLITPINNSPRYNNSWVVIFIQVELKFYKIPSTECFVHSPSTSYIKFENP